MELRFPSICCNPDIYRIKLLELVSNFSDLENFSTMNRVYDANSPGVPEGQRVRSFIPPFQKELLSLLPAAVLSGGKKER